MVNIYIYIYNWINVPSPYVTCINMELTLWDIYCAVCNASSWNWWKSKSYFKWGWLASLSTPVFLDIIVCHSWDGLSNIFIVISVLIEYIHHVVYMFLLSMSLSSWVIHPSSMLLYIILEIKLKLLHHHQCPHWCMGESLTKVLLCIFVNIYSNSTYIHI